MIRASVLAVGLSLGAAALAAPTAKAKANVLTLVLTGDTGGEIAPCG